MLLLSQWCNLASTIRSLFPLPPYIARIFYRFFEDDSKMKILEIKSRKREFQFSPKHSNREDRNFRTSLFNADLTKEAEGSGIQRSRKERMAPHDPVMKYSRAARLNQRWFKPDLNRHVSSLNLVYRLVNRASEQV